MLLCQLITDGNELTFFPRPVLFIHLLSAISGAKLRSQRKYQSVPTKEMCSNAILYGNWMDILCEIVKRRKILKRQLRERCWD
jgi:hypothetical protein